MPFPAVPEPTLAWVLSTTGADRVTAVQPLAGGWTSAMHALVVERAGRRQELVLRRLFREPWRAHAVALLEREASVLRLLAGSGVPVARLLALDARAEAADAPALLMSRLPGWLNLAALDVDALARMLVRIHAFDPGAARPRVFESWAVPERRRVPDWSRRPFLWRQAFTAIGRADPPHSGVFLHRDFHPGNVLWSGAEVAGVVDWVETSWGPADLDVAHCCTALALLDGGSAPERFEAAYERHGGRLDADPAARRHWQLVDAIGFLPDPEKVTGVWRACGRTDLTPELARVRLEARVAALL